MPKKDKEAPAEVQATGPPAPPKPGSGYRAAAPWKGMPRWECEHCPFDSLDEALMKEHVLYQHLAKPVPRVVQVPLFDRFGNPITRTEEV